MDTTDPRHIDLDVPNDITPVRLDRFLADLAEVALTRSKIQKLIVDGQVTVNGAVVAKNFNVKGGESVSIEIPPPPPSRVIAEPIPIDIIYEDSHLAVVNKPPGMVTHPAAGHHTGTLVNALRHHFGALAEVGGDDRPGIVHRLDKGTSGLLVVARQDDVYVQLQKAIQNREVSRTYLAVVCGHMPDEAGLIDLPIGRSPRERTKMAVTQAHSRPAQTEYRRIREYRSYDYLEVSLLTGRTHQIRVHLAHEGRPVFGDPEYGGRDKWHRGLFAPERPLGNRLLKLIDRQMLHAARLSFVHPITGEELTLEAAPPPDFQAVMELLDSEGI